MGKSIHGPVLKLNRPFLICLLDHWIWARHGESISCERTDYFLKHLQVNHVEAGTGNTSHQGELGVFIPELPDDLIDSSAGTGMCRGEVEFHPWFHIFPHRLLKGGNLARALFFPDGECAF